MKGYTVIKSGIQHPDHPDLIGDLVQQKESGQFYILTTCEGLQELHSVPFKWARAIVVAETGR